MEVEAVSTPLTAKVSFLVCSGGAGALRARTDGRMEGRKEGRETAEFVVYCFGKYSLFLIRTALRGVNPYKLWVTLSQPLHTFCSRGRKYLNTNMIWDLWRLLV